MQVDLKQIKQWYTKYSLRFNSWRCEYMPTYIRQNNRQHSINGDILKHKLTRSRIWDSAGGQGSDVKDKSQL